jgi:hypothetical protein
MGMDVHLSMETIEKRELVRLAREGDRDAFGELFPRPPTAPSDSFVQLSSANR